MTLTTNPNSADTDGTARAEVRLASPLVAALEATWAAIQHRHPEIPDVVIVMAAGSVGVPRGALKLGHFAAMRWTLPADGAESSESAGAGEPVSLPEVFVGGEGLALGAVDVLGTLLHEATHALAHVRKVQDTSRQGRYHNRRFRDLAEEMGLFVAEAPGIGWSDTFVPEATRTDYADTLTALAAAIRIHRRSEGALVPATPGDENGATVSGPTGSTGATTGAGRGMGPPRAAGAGAGSASPPPSSRSARSPAASAASPSPPPSPLHRPPTRTARTRSTRRGARRGSTTSTPATT